MTNEKWLKERTVKEVPLQEKDGDKVVCGVCEHRCSIAEGKRGVCQCRANIGGKLFALTYGDISAIESRPIEIKPFHHFWPGSTALTFATWGCNFKCPWCQNFRLSKLPPDPGKGFYIPPERIVEKALNAGDQGLCASFNEPLMLFEYTLDAFTLARKKGLYNTYVSNGYMTLEALSLLKEAGLDGLKIDIKGGPGTYKRYCKAKEEIIWRNAKAAKEMDIHVEMVNLLIPMVNVDDVEDLVMKHIEFVGPDTPLHFTRYHPDHEFFVRATDVRLLEKALELARRKGIRFVYIGNVPGHKNENTLCPVCDNVLIGRDGPELRSFSLKGGRCPKCGTPVPIVGKLIKH